jgi:hypothetical protein
MEACQCSLITPARAHDLKLINSKFSTMKQTLYLSRLSGTICFQKQPVYCASPISLSMGICTLYWTRRIAHTEASARCTSAVAAGTLHNLAETLFLA